MGVPPVVVEANTQTYRMRLSLEGAALVSHFGETWSAYASHTPPFGVRKFVLAPEWYRSYDSDRHVAVHLRLIG